MHFSCHFEIQGYFLSIYQKLLQKSIRNLWNSGAHYIQCSCRLSKCNWTEVRYQHLPHYLCMRKHDDVYLYVNIQLRCYVNYPWLKLFLLIFLCALQKRIKYVWQGWKKDDWIPLLYRSRIDIAHYIVKVDWKYNVYTKLKLIWLV